VNAFASYRWRPSFGVSVKWLYGSGMPVRAFVEQRGNEYFLSIDRNKLRIPYYQRADLRVDKIFLLRRAQLTVFAEVLNFMNRRNVRFDDLSRIKPITGSVRLTIERTFPVLPAGGVTLSF